MDQYFAAQSDWIIEEYLGNYSFLNLPAIHFASWQEANKQLQYINQGMTRNKFWEGSPHEGDSWRVLYHPQQKYRQLWVRHSFGGYRKLGLKFLTQSVAHSSFVAGNWDADHLLPRSRAKSMQKNSVTVLQFIPANINRSWGSSYEKHNRSRYTKIRVGVTLLSVAKGIGIAGPATSTGRTFKHLASDLYDRGLISKMYEDDNIFGKHSELCKLESELSLVANVPEAEFLDPTGTACYCV